MSLLDELKPIKEYGPRYPDFGICHQLTLPAHRKVFTLLVPQWPKFSGDAIFPIPCPKGGFAEEAYYAHTYGQMWDKGGEYGRLRWELLDWCIAELEKQQ